MLASLIMGSFTFGEVSGCAKNELLGGGHVLARVLGGEVPASDETARAKTAAAAATAAKRARTVEDCFRM